MNRNGRTVKKSGNTLISGCVIGIIAALVTAVLLTLLLTSLAINGSSNEESIGLYVLVAHAVASLVGGIASVTIAKERYMVVIGMVVLGYMLILVGLGIVLYDRSFVNFGFSLLSAVLGGVLACLIKMKPIRKKNKAIHLRR